MSLADKYFQSIEYFDPVVGKPCYRLIFLDDGETVHFYTEYLKFRATNGAALNTIRALASDLKSFLSYVFAGVEIITEKSPESSSCPLSDLILSYPTFLANAKTAASDLARLIAVKLDSKPVSESTKNRRLSSVQDFIRESARFQVTINELAQLQLINTNLPPKTFGEELLSKRFATKSERLSFLNKSFLYGCISGGAKYVNSSLFSTKMISARKASGSDKAFPAGSIVETLNQARTNRDRALWALLAGTGIRISEASNLLIEDVDGLQQQVLIVSPSKRIHKYPYSSIVAANLMPFKGRATEETFFIQPFKKIFFESLRAYLSYERGNPNHNVLFVNLSNQYHGRPLYLAKNANTYNKTFKRACRLAGVTGYTIHSLRHFYGYFCLNFLLTEHGYGLPIQTVQFMMGHSFLDSTRNYAVSDREITKLIINQFNESIEKNGLRIDELVKKATNLIPPER